MQSLQHTLNSNELVGLFQIPTQMRNKKVEVRITLIEEKSEKSTAFGSLHQFANPALQSKEQGAWEQAVYEKHTAY
jgi:hypothetical protein